jgi:hypothetical protein
VERYIVIHELKSGVSQDEAWQVCHKLATSTVKGATWLRSYIVGDRDEMICDWEAENEAAILESLRAAGGEHLSPVKQIALAVYMDPEIFK